MSSPTRLVVNAMPLVSRKVGGLVGMKVMRSCQSINCPEDPPRASVACNCQVPVPGCPISGRKGSSGW